MLEKTLQQKKVKTARLSILSNSFLILLKIVAGILSGSVSIISEAIHSSMDLMAALIAFFSVKMSARPPDKEHPYGHGKFENVSGVIEALLIFVAAGWIIYEAIKKLLEPKMPDSIGIGMLVMFISAAVNFVVSHRLYKVAKLTDSVALEADALHLKTDIYTSLGVCIGLILIWITKVKILDPIVAILVACLILYESYSLFKKAYSPLLDTQIPDDEIKLIETIINRHLAPDMNYHMLRTRKSGNMRYVDLHLELPGSLSVMESHDLCDRIENDIISQIKTVEVQIHTEPCEIQSRD
jgi:cation diffusion facilitator family transporter